MNFEDVLKKIFADDFFNNISLAEILMSFGIVLLIGIIIYMVYRLKNRTEFYLSEFNVILIILPIITCALVMSMQYNVGLSLGMIGALSIIRFRNAVKSSLDLMFLFWSISIGIICGGGLYLLAIILTILISIILLFFDLLPSKKTNYLLIINGQKNMNTEKILKIIHEYTKKYKIKSTCVGNNTLDLIIDVYGKKLEKIVYECSKIKGVENINLLSNDGEIKL